MQIAPATSLMWLMCEENSLKIECFVQKIHENIVSRPISESSFKPSNHWPDPACNRTHVVNIVDSRHFLQVDFGRGPKRAETTLYHVANTRIRCVNLIRINDGALVHSEQPEHQARSLRVASRLRSTLRKANRRRQRLYFPRNGPAKGPTRSQCLCGSSGSGSGRFGELFALTA